MGLYDGILIKDNHLASCEDPRNAVPKIGSAIASLPTQISFPVEVEVDKINQLDLAFRMLVWIGNKYTTTSSLEQVEWLSAIILLDNMSLDELREAVRWRRNERLPFILLEASGGITLDSV